MHKGVYVRPDKPKFSDLRFGKREKKVDILPERPVVLTVDCRAECHVTPPDVALRMVAYAGLDEPESLWCDPSAGTGNLVQAMLDSGVAAEQITAIEINISLNEFLAKRFPLSLLYSGCCLGYAQQGKHRSGFKKVVMNPPFSRVKAHVLAAVEMLSFGGTLVALVPVTFDLDGFELVETLPPDTFATAKVHTKIVRYFK